MSLLFGNGVRGVLLLLALFTAATLYQDARTRPFGAAPVIDARDARSLSRAAGYPEEFLWERARTMGVVGVLVRPQTLRPFLRSGEALAFSNAEIRKLEETGLAGPAGALTERSIWIKGDALFERLIKAFEVRGARPEVRTVEGKRVVELPAGKDPGSVSVGFDPELVGAVVANGLVPVLECDDGADFALARGEGKSSSSRVYLADMSAGRVWPALPDHRVIAAEEMPVSAGPAALLRAISGRGRGLIVLRLDARGTLERELDSLRDLLKGMRGAGYAQGFPPVDWEPREASPGEVLLRVVSGLAFLLAGPLAAFRTGLGALRAVSRNRRFPEASPFLEGLAGAGTAAGVAAFFGLAAHALFSFSAAGPALPVERWSAWTGPGALALAYFALYSPDRGTPARWRAEPARFAVLPAAAFLVLLAFSPPWFERYGPAATLNALASWAPEWWWTAARWREMLIGFPCLFTGFCLHCRRLHKDLPGERADPRLWLLFGAFGPIGLVAAVSRTATPFLMSIHHSFFVLAAGAAAGLVLFGARELLAGRPHNPHEARHSGAPPR